MDLLHENDVEVNVEDADYSAMSLLIGQHKPDVIVQLAAVSHANKSNKDPHTTFDHTLRTLENTLDISKGLGCHVIYFSSSMVYGNFNSKSVNEETPCNPLGIYGTLKYSGELIVKAYKERLICPTLLLGHQLFMVNAGESSS